MLINFSPINIMKNPAFITQDETDILIETEKLEREEKSYATIYEPELFSTDSTCEF